jgi:three-Cys-motif partner protein
MATDDFFDEPKEHSKVKATIVSKYFKAWAGVMIATLRRFERQEKIAYTDLFSGPGRYEDGTPSTPLEILQFAIENENC